MSSSRKVSGVILAGGRSRRFGQPKSGGLLVGETLLQRVIARLKPQTSRLALSVGEEDGLSGSGSLTRLPDIIGPGLGPLAGIHAALTWVKAKPRSPQWVLTAPVDAPFLPMDLAARLMQEALEGEALGAIAASGGRAHPLHGLWHTDLLGPIEDAMDQGMRSANAFAESQQIASVEWDVVPNDPFFNINTQEDIALAEAALAASTTSSKPGSA